MGRTGWQRHERIACGALNHSHVGLHGQRGMKMSSARKQESHNSTPVDTPGSGKPDRFAENGDCGDEIPV